MSALIACALYPICKVHNIYFVTLLEVYLLELSLWSPVTDKIIVNASSYKIIIYDLGKVDKQTDIESAVWTSVLVYNAAETISKVDLSIQNGCVIVIEQRVPCLLHAGGRQPLKSDSDDWQTSESKSKRNKYIIDEELNIYYLFLDTNNKCIKCGYIGITFNYLSYEYFHL